MNKWNNKFRYQVASCWLFILSYKYISIARFVYENTQIRLYRVIKKVSVHLMITIQKVCASDDYNTERLCTWWLQYRKSVYLMITIQKVCAPDDYNTESLCTWWLQYRKAVHLMITIQKVCAPDDYNTERGAQRLFDRPVSTYNCSQT